MILCTLMNRCHGVIVARFGVVVLMSLSLWPPQLIALDQRSVAEMSITELQAGMAAGTFSAEDIVAAYLARIERYNDTLRAAITVNPDALTEAERLDTERAEGKLRGPLHGIPLAIKDNILVAGMPATGGAVAFAEFVPTESASLIDNLRDAGAIVIAKTTLSELGNWVSHEMPGGYNAVLGHSLNPYDPRVDPREGMNGRAVMSPSGSSSGVGTAASLWAASVGTETIGSILSPASATMLVGIKPTLGRISRRGIIPITLDHDTAGPMARNVRDAALLLGAMEGSVPDPDDAASGACKRPPGNDYTAGLESASLAGARIGIPRDGYYDPVEVPGRDEPAGGLDPDHSKMMRVALNIIDRERAVLVDPVEIPSVVDPDPEKNFFRTAVCAGDTEATPDDCSTVLIYGAKRDFNAFLEDLGDAAPVGSLAELIAFNEEHAEDRNTIVYGQQRLAASEARDLETDRERYQRDREKDLFLAREHGLDPVFAQHDLDALVFPGPSAADIAARAGYPVVIVPFGFIREELDPPLPEDFNPHPRPYGVSFVGPACSERLLIEIAHAFEQRAQRRIPPRRLR